MRRARILVNNKAAGVLEQVEYDVYRFIYDEDYHYIKIRILN